MRMICTGNQLRFRLTLLSLVLGVSAGAQIAVKPAGAPRSSASRILRLRSTAPRASQDSQDNQGGGSWAAPLSGYVADPDGHSIRPVVGFRMFSFIGNRVDVGDDVASVLSSPNQDYVTEVSATGVLSLWLGVPGGLGDFYLPGDVSLTSRVEFGPLGYSLAVISEERELVQIFYGLPNSPSKAFSASFSDLGGAPNVLAISDDGTTLLFTIRGDSRDSLYAFRGTGQLQLLYVGEQISSVAFAPNSLTAVVTDAAANQVNLLRNVTGFFVPSLLADENAGVSGPIAAQFSRDGKQIAVAESRTGIVQMFGLDGTLGSSTPARPQEGIPRPSRPMISISQREVHRPGVERLLLSRMIGNAVFRITDFDGSSIAVFDGDSQPPAVFQVGPEADEDPAISGAGAMPKKFAVTQPPQATVTGSSLSGSSPSASCAPPASQKYFLQDGVIYPWINLSSSNSDSVTISIQGTATAASLGRASASLGCYFGQVSLSGIAPGDYTLIFNLNGASSQTQSFTIVQNQVTLIAAGGAIQPLPGASQASLQIPRALPDIVSVGLTPNFIPNGVVNGLAGAVYDCRRLQSSGSITIPAGQTQSSPFTVSVGTVAGTCGFSTGSVSVGNPALSFVPPSAQVSFTDSVDAPTLNPATVTNDWFQTGSGLANGFYVVVSGVATTRDLTSITYTFTAVPGYTINAASPPYYLGGVVTLTKGSYPDFQAGAVSWFTSQASASTGGSFLYKQQFTVYNSNLSVPGAGCHMLQSVSITVTSSAGTSAPVSVSIPYDVSRPCVPALGG